MSVVWNPWHGCKKFSEGCKNCYVYRIDAAHGRDASRITKNKDFDLPVKRKRDGSYKIPDGETVYTCFSSDFLLEDADGWRKDAWGFMRERRGLRFVFLTKRIHRLKSHFPDDWGNGYDNVSIGCTCENQDMADYRLPIFLYLPIKHRIIICEPLLSDMNLEKYLDETVEEVIAGGESGAAARICSFDWILHIRSHCVNAGVSFYFKQTGTKFQKDGHIYTVDRKLQHSQAKKAGINLLCDSNFSIV